MQSNYKTSYSLIEKRKIFNIAWQHIYLLEYDYFYDDSVSLFIIFYNNVFFISISENFKPTINFIFVKFL